MDVATLQLTVHASLGAPEAPSPEAVEASRVWALDEYAELGHGDFVYSPQQLAAIYADQSRRRCHLVLARDADRCVGLASLEVPLTDNRHLLAVDFRIDPDRDATVVLGALWPVLEELRQVEDRDTIVAGVSSATPGEPLVPRTGAGAVRRTPVTDWLQARGFVLEQAEVASTLEVAGALDHAATLEAAAETASEDYEVLSWVGVTPPELREAMAEQRARMSTDVPLGDIALEPEVWDAARVLAEDAAIEAMNRSLVWTIARDRATREVVAHTLLVCPDDDLPEVAYQEDTLVRAEHRGHRLGMRVKAANLRTLAVRRPGVRRIHTWNADENDWMLAINRKLGFSPTSTMGCWQLRMEER